MADADLARFSGHYAGEGIPLETQVEKVGGKLRLSLPGGRLFILVPVASDTFRVVGALGLLVAFDVKEGRVARLHVQQPGVPELVFAFRP